MSSSVLTIQNSPLWAAINIWQIILSASGILYFQYVDCRNVNFSCFTIIQLNYFFHICFIFLSNLLCRNLEKELEQNKSNPDNNKAPKRKSRKKCKGKKCRQGKRKKKTRGPKRNRGFRLKVSRTNNVVETTKTPGPGADYLNLPINLRSHCQKIDVRRLSEILSPLSQKSLENLYSAIHFKRSMI